MVIVTREMQTSWATRPIVKKKKKNETMEAVDRYDTLPLLLSHASIDSQQENEIHIFYEPGDT